MKILSRKCIWGIALAVFLLSNTVFSIYVFAQSEVQSGKADVPSEETYVGDFNLSTYQADVYLKNDTICNRIIKFMMDKATFPSQKITEYLANKGMFQASVAGWEGIHWAVSPSEIAKGAVDQKGYYTAIILSVFKAEMDNDIFIIDNANKIVSTADKILSNLKKWVEEMDKIEWIPISKNQILTTIPVEQQKMIQENLSKEFKKNHPVLGNSSSITEDLAMIFDSAKTLWEAVQLMESYIRLTEIADNMKAVLTEMYNQCPEEKIFMKSALREAASATKNLEGAVKATISNTAGKETALVLGALLEDGWKKLIEQNPYAAAFKAGADVGAWLGDSVCNTLFSTDKTIEQYEKMKCLGEFTELLKSVSKTMGEDYLSNKSTRTAENYFASIEALFSAADLSCGFAEDYGKILYKDSSLGWLTISEANYQSYTNSVKSIRNSYNEQQESLFNNYLAELESDYPDIYASLMGLNTPDPIPVTGIAFDYDTDKIWLDMLLLPTVKKPVIYPVNATNKKVTYTSSDPTILDVNEKSGDYFAKKAGTVTITATTEDGRFTDTVTVQVIAGKDSAWDAVSLPRVVDKGKCGENVYWVLYKGGKLVVSGEGEMYRELPSWSKRWSEQAVISAVIESGVSSIGNRSFVHCNRLKSIKIPSSVTKIGDSAFEGCSNLNSIEVPSSVTEIGDLAYKGCSSLKSIEIPSNVTSIGYGAFAHCRQLLSIELPHEIKIIESEAFLGCECLEQIILGDGIEYVGSACFADCISLENIQIKSDMTMLGKGAFDNTKWFNSLPEGTVYIGKNLYGYKGDITQLTHLKVGDGVRNIAEGAFEHATNLERIDLSGNVSIIGSRAFHNAEKLKEVSIPGNVSIIGREAFHGCKGIKKIYISPEVKEIRDAAFADCTNVDELYFDGSNVAISYERQKIFEGIGIDNVHGTNVIFGEHVTDIPVGLFLKDNVVSVDIGCNVSSVPANRISACKNLKTVIFRPEQCMVIEKNAFPNSLKKLILADTVKALPDYAFKDYVMLESIEASSNLAEVGTESFEGTKWLERQPDGAVYIGNVLYVYKGETPQILEVREGTISIAEKAFEKKYLEEIILPGTIEKIGNECFLNCTQLTHLTLSENIRIIGNEAFYGCENLETISYSGVFLPNRKKIIENEAYIGKKAFKGLKKIKEVKIPNGILEICEEAFYNGQNLAKVTLNGNVKKLGDRCFCWTDIHSIILPEGVKSIGSNVFGQVRSKMSVYSILIPESVTSIDKNVIGNEENNERNNIICTKGSYADAYAKENGYNCYYIDEEYPYLAVDETGTFLFDCISTPQEILIPKRIKSICNWTFLNLMGINQCAPEGGFLYSDRIEKVKLQGDVSGLSFKSLSGVKELVIGKDVQDLSGSCFERKLDTILIEKGNTSIEYDGKFLYGESGNKIIYCFDDNMSSYHVPETIKNIGEYAFKDCDKLQNVTLPRNLEKLEENSFPSRFIEKEDDWGEDYYINVCKFSQSHQLVAKHGFRVNRDYWEKPENIQYITLKQCNIYVEKNLIYTGGRIQPEVTIMYGNILLNGSDSWGDTNAEYVYELSGDSEIGTGYVEIYGVEKEGIKDEILKVDYKVLPADTVLQGKCNEAVSWKLDCGTGILTISGTGKIPSYTDGEKEEFGGAPWLNYQKQIKKIVIEDGITEIGSYGFADCENLNWIDIADTVTCIKTRAIYNCSKLEVLYLPPNSDCSYMSVENCYKLKLVYVPNKMNAYPIVGGWGFTIVGNTDVLEKLDNYEGIDRNKKINIDHVSSISIEEFPALTDYYVNEILELDGLKLKIEYDDGTEPTIVSDGFIAELPDMSTSGKKLVQIQYLKNIFEFEVNIKDTDDVYPETEHPYKNQEDQEWEYEIKGAQMLEISFSKDTAFCYEDFLFVYDKEGNEVGQYEYDDLAGNKIFVKGDMVKLKFVNSSGGSNYGFKIISIKPVEPVLLEGIFLSQDEVELSIGRRKTLSVNYKPHNAMSISKPIWSSSNTRIASVDDEGEILAKRMGTATITVVVGEYTASCIVHVSGDIVKVDNLEEFQSSHPYESDEKKCWCYEMPGADFLEITFSKQTKVEEDCDFLTVYDAEGNYNKTFTGKELAGKTILISGDTLYVELDADGSEEEYGFSVEQIDNIFLKELQTREFQVKVQNVNDAVVSWKKAENADGYEIYRAENSFSNFQKVYDSNAKQMTWTDKKLNAGKTYSYKMYAYIEVDGERYYGLESQTKTIVIANPQKPTKKSYKIVFNANGGMKLSQSSRNIVEGKGVGKLPAVQRKAYHFLGWYTKKTGGNKISANTKIAKNQTFYAHWSKAKKPGKGKIPKLKALKKGQIQVTYKKVSNVKGYEVSYSTDKKFKKPKTKKVIVSSLRKTIKNLKRGKVYYVRIRAYQVDSAKNKIYGDYSKAKKIKVK